MRAHMHQAVYITQEDAGVRAQRLWVMARFWSVRLRIDENLPLSARQNRRLTAEERLCLSSVVCRVCFVIGFKTLPGVSWFVSPGESGPLAHTASAGAVTATPVSIKLKRSEGLECPPNTESDIYGHSDDRWCFNVLLLWVFDLHAFRLWHPVAENKLQMWFYTTNMGLICW